MSSLMRRDETRPQQGPSPGTRLVIQGSAGLFLLAMLLLIPLSTQRGQASAQDKPDNRFDHTLHLDKVKDCGACHAMSAKTGWVEKRKTATGRGGNEHRPCSNNGCHANQFATSRPGKFCWSCHTGTLRYVKYPPYRGRGESQFYVKPFSHKDHIRDKDKGCEQCHSPAKKKKVRRARRGKKAVYDTSLDMKQVDHKVCGERICHGESVNPKMAECSGCHVLRGDDTVTPLGSATTSKYRVNLAYDHAEHGKKSGETRCGTCHNNVNVAKGATIPLPEMATCEGCHNGTTAFSALGHKCQSCHLIPEDQR